MLRWSQSNSRKRMSPKTATIMRAAKTRGEAKFGFGGLHKTRGAPKKVTLAKTPWDKSDAT